MKDRDFSHNPTPSELIYIWARIKREPWRIKVKKFKGVQGRPQNPKQLEMF